MVWCWLSIEGGEDGNGGDQSSSDRRGAWGSWILLWFRWQVWTGWSFKIINVDPWDGLSDDGHVLLGSIKTGVSISLWENRNQHSWSISGINCSPVECLSFARVGSLSLSESSENMANRRQGWYSRSTDLGGVVWGLKVTESGRKISSWRVILSILQGSNVSLISEGCLPLNCASSKCSLQINAGSSVGSWSLRNSWSIWNAHWKRDGHLKNVFLSFYEFINVSVVLDFLLVEVVLLHLEVGILLSLGHDVSHEDSRVNHNRLSFLEGTIFSREEDYVTDWAWQTNLWVSFLEGKCGGWGGQRRRSLLNWVEENSIGSCVISDIRGWRLSCWEDSVGSQTSDIDPLYPLEGELSVIGIGQSDAWSSIPIAGQNEPRALASSSETLLCSENSLVGCVGLDGVLPIRAPLGTIFNGGASVRRVVQSGHQDVLVPGRRWEGFVLITNSDGCCGVDLEDDSVWDCIILTISDVSGWTSVTLCDIRESVVFAGSPDNYISKKSLSSAIWLSRVGSEQTRRGNPESSWTCCLCNNCSLVSTSSCSLGDLLSWEDVQSISKGSVGSDSLGSDLAVDFSDVISVVLLSSVSSRNRSSTNSAWPVYSSWKGWSSGRGRSKECKNWKFHLSFLGF